MNIDTKKDYVGVKFDKSSRRGSRREWKTDKEEPKTLKHEGMLGRGCQPIRNKQQNKKPNQNTTKTKVR